LPDLKGIYNYDDGHFAERGYELLARELVKFLAPIVEAQTRGLETSVR
jgi:hypothetical protein